MKINKVENEEVKQGVSCAKCGSVDCNGSNCALNKRCGGNWERPHGSWGWRIFSVIFRMILMLIILGIVFALGAAVGGARVLGYVGNGDLVYGPGMMRGTGMMGDWNYKTEQLMGTRYKIGQMMSGYGSLDNLQVNSQVRIYGNIVEVRSGELTISDNAGKNIDVISGVFTIIETSKGEIGIKDLKVDEGVTVYGVLTGEGTIRASGIKVSR